MNFFKFVGDYRPRAIVDRLLCVNLCTSTLSQCASSAASHNYRRGHSVPRIESCQGHCQVCIHGIHIGECFAKSEQLLHQADGSNVSRIISQYFVKGVAHGDDAFSGKDSTVVDWFPVFFADNDNILLKTGMSNRPPVQLSYAIGVAKRCSLQLETF